MYGVVTVTLQREPKLFVPVPCVELAVRDCVVVASHLFVLLKCSESETWLFASRFGDGSA